MQRVVVPSRALVVWSVSPAQKAWAVQKKYLAQSRSGCGCMRKRTGLDAVNLDMRTPRQELTFDPVASSRETDHVEPENHIAKSVKVGL